MSLLTKELLSDDALKESLCAELEAAMDAELVKPEKEINLELLEDLSNALLLLSGSEKTDGALTAATVKAFRTKHRFAAMRRALGSTAAMAAIAVLCYAAVTAKTPQPVPVEPSTVITETTTAPAEAATVPATESTTATTEPVTEPSTQATTAQSTAARTETATTQAATERYRAVKGADVPDIPDTGDDGNPEDDTDYYYDGHYGGYNSNPDGLDGLTETEMTLDFNGAFQRRYAVGEAFNPRGITVTMIGEDGSYTVDISRCTVTGFSSETPGRKTVTVHYQYYQTSFTVEVIEA